MGCDEFSVRFLPRIYIESGKTGQKSRENEGEKLTWYDRLCFLHVAEMPLNSCHTPFSCGVLLSEKRELFEEMKNLHALTKSGVHHVEGRRRLCVANGSISYSKQSF